MKWSRSDCLRSIRVLLIFFLVHLKWRLFSYVESKLRNAPLPIFCVELHRSLSTKSLLYCFDLLSLVYSEQRRKYSLRICRHVSLFIFIYLATRCLRSRLPGSHMFCFCILLFLSFLRIVCQPFNLDFHWTDFHAVFTVRFRHGCRWSIETSIFDFLRDVAMATNFLFPKFRFVVVTHKRREIRTWSREKKM